MQDRSSSPSRPPQPLVRRSSTSVASAAARPWRSARDRSDAALGSARCSAAASRHLSQPERHTGERYAAGSTHNAGALLLADDEEFGQVSTAGVDDQRVAHAETDDARP